MLLVLFIIPSITLFILAGFWALNSKLKDSVFQVIGLYLPKILTLVSVSLNLLYSSYLWKLFPSVEDKSPSAFVLREVISPIIVDSVPLFEVQHNLSLPFIILSTFVLLIALLTAWYSSVNMLLLCVILLLIELCLVGSFSCTSIFAFLLFFEASALPIFILIAYCGSARRERLKATYYFLFFTLYGSLSLLLLILNFYGLSQLDFLLLSQEQSSNYTLWLLLFVAFAVKIPLFPFHIWLPYAHVEASTYTSIILAALMLKLGGYGVVKFILPLFSVQTHLFFRPLALLICVAGTIYGGLCALRQIDMKRQIAFSSISHMSFATTGIFTLTEAGVKGSIYLMLSHGLTSAALFYLVGVLSDRYHTRSIVAFSGLLSSMPVFSFFLLFISLANVGFPGTSGFLPELIVLVGVVSTTSTLLLPILLGIFLTTASTLVLLLRALFGHTKVFYFKSSWVDVSKLEFFVLFILTLWVLILGLCDILNFSV